MSRIGYNQLSAAEKKAYEQFERAFNSCSSTVDSNGICKKSDPKNLIPGYEKNGMAEKP